MKNHYSLYLTAVLLTLSQFSTSQVEEKSNVSPGGLYELIYDQEGNSMPLGELSISRSVQQNTVQIECDNYTGYFNLYFDPGSGMEIINDPVHIARRECLCQVMQDLSNFIIPADPTTPVNIRVRAIDNVYPFGLSAFRAASASSYFVIPVSENQSASGGLIDGQIQRTILSGHDAYEGVASPLVSSGSANDFYHGFITVNFNNNQSFDWHTDLSTATSENKLDLYSTCMHEMLHALGFTSLIGFDGYSKIGAAQRFYSRYDTFLQKEINSGMQNWDELITSFNANQVYNWQWNSGVWGTATNNVLQPILQPNFNSECPDPGSYSDDAAGNAEYQFDLFDCAVNGDCETEDCTQSVRFFGQVNQKVYTPQCYFSGSSLSHLSEQCYNPDPLPDGSYYSMSPIVGIGPDGMHRYPQCEERLILCEIGYAVNTIYGNSLYPSNQHDYTTPDNCNGNGESCFDLWVAGTHDGYFDDEYLYTGVENSPITICAGDELTPGFLTNDFMATTFMNPEVVIGSGSIAVVEDIPECGHGIEYTPTSGGYHLIRYLPFNEDLGIYGNITYIVVFVTSSSCSSNCGFIPNGGFESTNVDCANGNQFTNSVDCWQSFTATPDLIGTECSTYSDTYLDTESENFHFIRLRGHWNTSNPDCTADNVNLQYEESIWCSLTSPIVPGSYNVSFWAKSDQNTCFTICGHYSTIGSGSNCYPHPLITVLKEGIQIVGDGEWHWYNEDFEYSGLTQLVRFYIGNDASYYYFNVGGGVTSEAFVDEVVLTGPPPVLPTLNLPNLMCLDASLENLEQYVSESIIDGVFAVGNGVELLSDGTYIFTPPSEGTYTIEYSFPIFGCNYTISSSIEVLNYGSPTIEISADPSGSVCPGSAVSLTATGGLDYVWTPLYNILPTDGLGQQVNVTPEIGTIYSVLGTDANGCWNIAEIEVNVDEGLNVQAVGDNVLCPGETQITLYVENGVNSTLIWSPSESLNTNQGQIVTASPTEQTTYSVTGTTINGCPGYDEITVIFNDNPTLNVYGDLELCEGDNVFLIATGATSFDWFTNGILVNSGQFLTGAATSSVVYDLVGILNGCSSEIQVNLQVNEVPDIILEPFPVVYCIDSNPETIQLSGALNYQWFPDDDAIVVSNNGSTVTIVSAPAPEYEIIGTDQNGCSASFNLTVETQQAPTIISEGQTICNGETALLELTGADNYAWTNIEEDCLDEPCSTIEVTPGNTFTYSYIGYTFNTQCQTLGSVQVIVNPSPVLSVTPENPSCSTEPDGSITAEVQNSDGSPGDFVWIPSDNDNVDEDFIWPDLVASEYTISVSNEFNCVTEESILLEANACCDLEDYVTIPIVVTGNSQLSDVATAGIDGNYYINTSITVETNGNLTIPVGTLIYFGPDGVIFVKEGGYLSVFLSTLTTFPGCNHMWHGIEGWYRTYLDHQSGLPGELIGPPAHIYLRTAVVENAHIGVLLGRRNWNSTSATNAFYNYSGGAGLEATENTVFRNCGIGVQFMNTAYAQSLFPPQSYDSNIQNCFFETSGALNDPHYNSADPDPYPNSAYPWAGQANYSQRMDVGILIRERRWCAQIENNQLSGIERGIRMLRSVNNIEECNFDHMNYGIQAIELGKLGFMRISDNTFSQIHHFEPWTAEEDPPYNYTDYNTAAILLRNGQGPRLSGNTFGISGEVQTDNIIGLYAENLKLYAYDGNIFNRLERGAILLNCSGAIFQSATSEDKNVFNDCRLGVITDLNCKNLLLRCNEHNNSDLLYSYDANWANAGVLGQQGQISTGANENNLGAGNIFAPGGRDGIVANDQNDGDAETFTYVHQHTDVLNDPFNIVPEALPDNGMTTLITVLNDPNTNIDASWDPISSCTPLEGFAPGGENLQTVDEKIEIETQNLGELFLLIDGFNQNTYSLLTAIYGGIQDEQELRDYLQQNSPLSSEVLEAYMERYNVPSEYFRDVMMMNSVVESELRALLNERIQNLPETIQDELKLVLDENPMYETIGEILGRLNLLERQRDAIITGLEEEYTLTGNLFTLEELLLNEETNSARQSLFDLYFLQQDMNSAQDILDELDQNEPNIADWEDLANLALDLYFEDRSWSELNSVEQDLILSLTNLDPADNPAYFAARAIQSISLNEDPPLLVPVVIVNGEPRSYSAEKPSLNAIIYPNPCHNYFRIEAMMGEKDQGELWIFDAGGRKIRNQLFNSSIEPALVEVNDLNPGTYLVKVYLSGKLILQHALVVQ